MSEKTRIIYYALWIAHPVIQTAIALFHEMATFASAGVSEKIE